MKKIFWSFLEIFKTVAIAVVAVVLFRSFIAQPFLVSGSSMEPTFKNGDYLLIDELVYRFREPERGEVAVFKYPGNHKAYYIKRIIGMPGERIVVENGKVKIYNNQGEIVLKEPYLNAFKSVGYLDVTLNNNQYFVMGDNRNFSFDSRNWGPLSKAEIIGLTRLRLWPINNVMAFSAPIY